MNGERLRIWIAFLIVSTVWGSTWLAIKIGLATVPPFLAAGVRFIVAAGVLLVIIRFTGAEISRHHDARRVYLTLGLLSFTLPFALVYWGQQFIPTGLSSILFGAYPFWVALFSRLWLPGERLDLFKIAGILIGFAGLVTVFSSDTHWSDPNAFRGMAAILGSTMLQGFSLVMVKRYGQAVSPFAMNFVGMSIGGTLLLTLSAIVEPVASATWTFPAVASVLYLAAIGSVLTFVSYYWLLKRIDAVYLSLTSFINPIVAVILGSLVLDETLGASVLFGAALVLTGILTAHGRQLYGKLRSVSAPGQ